MNPRPPIDCGLHDHIEVACLYGYHLELQMHDGDRQTGTAVTTRTEQGREFLVLQGEDGKIEVDLAGVSQIRALTDNRYFQVLDLDADRRCGI
ncbi:Rho-binding antiterminator [Bowmanella dokdonensis]|uniref:Rho-binding antiterminator n=1 Tax=Bowmanella dokdonensis TaxID=751969 RepID=A0A939DPB7_9ALTE|nr:Rho-binding antiterminator [Bowmanella dokdonensis]MBN7825790.1 Rho-binding antiterminator [Bowmanella dokdonensis]